MPRFPRKKNDILIQAAKILFGIQNNPGEFPNPPFDPAPLSGLLGDAVTQEAQAVADEAKGRQSRATASETIFDKIPDEAQRLLTLVEAIFPGDAMKMQLLEWDLKAEPTFFPPGQVRDLVVVAQGPGTARLDWNPPIRTATTGDVLFYVIERQIRDLTTNTITEEFGVWKETATESEKELIGQPRMVEISYRVRAVNNNGQGQNSDTETAVL